VRSETPAALQGIEFAGDYDAARDDKAQPYYVPDDTLLSEVAFGSKSR